MSQKDAIALRKARLSSRRGELPEVEQALFETLLKGESTDLAVPATIPPRGAFSPAPLSFAQQQLWLMDQLKPGNVAYNIPLTLSLTGALDVAALGASLAEVVRRHETLRTTFDTVDGQPAEIVAAKGVMPLPVVDLCGLPSDERDTEARRLAAREAQRSFDLKRGPLMRVTLLRLEEEEHLLFLTQHHIVSDGWSMELLIQEMFTLYLAFAAGQPSPLPELPIQYADYAVWQRARLQGEGLAQQFAYWKKQLAGAPAVLELPVDRARPPVQSYRGATHTFMLPQSLTEALRTLSRQAGTTLFMTLLAAFQALLSRYSGQADIVVGSPIAGRSRAELEGLIGYFVNMLVLRTDLSGNPTFRELLGRVREVALGAYAHQDVPFEMLVDALKPERSLSYSPLFQVAFALQNISEAWETSTLNMEFWERGEGTAKFDLTLAVSEVEEGLWVSFEYSTDLFEAATIARFAEHWQVLLGGIVAHPEARLAELPLLTEGERQRVLVEWNEGRAKYPEDRCLHELFEQQVARTPDAVAVVFEEMSLTYQELNRRANQLAQYLRALNIGPESFVGLCVGRSVELVVGILGILKAGGAYVPMNPSFPVERLAYMLNDTHVPILLTERRWVEQLPVGDYRVICLDTEWETIAQASGAQPVSGVVPDNLAYVIYTSGSTGRPKGVTLSHANICPLLYWGYEHLGLTNEDRTIQYLSYCFDWAAWEIFITLTSGASLLVMPDDKLLDAAATLELIGRNKITVLHGTPTQFQFLIGSGASLEGIHYACIGAETLSLDLAERCHQLLEPRSRVYNMYGPTETAIVAATLEVEHRQLSKYSGLSSIPVGPPIANARCYVLDQQQRVQPIGVPGELYIAGDGVARGYWGRAELTAEKFLPDPFKPQARMYRTGDLTRWLPDGTLEFLGRLDFQVKIRGFRVELAEIETLLRQHPAVQEAVVLARPKPGNSRATGRELELVVYVVGREGCRPVIGQLHDFLREKLPSYMLPAAFVVLDTLPLTATGKLDRSALPAPDQNSFVAETYLAPRTPLEETLAGVWAEVLGLPRVGVTDNFFELGGHSLLAAHLMARIREKFEQQLPLETLFRAPTIEHLADTLYRYQGKSVPTSSLVLMQPGDSTKQPLFLVHAVGGTVFCYMDLCRILRPERPLYALQAAGLDDTREPCDQVEEMARSYIELIQTVQPIGPYLLGGWSMGGVVAFEMAQQLQAQGQAVALLALIDSYATTGEAGPEPDEAALVADFAVDLGQLVQRGTLESDRFEQLGPDERLMYVLDEAKRASVIPLDVEPAQIQRLFHVFKANVQAARCYVPRRYSGQITLFKASERSAEQARDDNLGWSALNVGGLTAHEIPGDHYTIIREPGVQILAEQFKNHLLAVEMAENK